MNDIISEIQSKLESKIILDYDMGKSTWFRVGGKALGYIIADNINDLKIILSYKDKINYFIIGVGSNLLVRDDGFDGIIIKLGKKFNRIEIKKNFLYAGSAVLDVKLSKFASDNHIKNFEFFSGIPGTVGGAVKMNAGCYGFQTADNLKRVLILNKFSELEYINVKNLNLNYRTSKIDDKSIILEAEFKFEYGSQEEIKRKIDKIKLQRKLSQPLREKNFWKYF